MSLDYVRFHAVLTDVFPEEECTFRRFKELMKQLSLTDTIIWCCRLNLLITNPRPESDQDVQQVLINHFLTSEQINKLNELAIKKGGADRVFCFFRGQLLQLLRWATLLCKDLEDDGTTFEKPETREIFLKCALIASEIWTNETYEEQLGTEPAEDREEFMKETLECFRKGSTTTNSTSYPVQYIPRGKEIICNILPKKMPEFETEFTAASDMTLQQYYAVSIALAAMFNNGKLSEAFKTGTSGLFNLHEIDAGASKAKKDEFNAFNQRFFKLEAQDASELKNAFWNGVQEDDENIDQIHLDFKSLRQKPIFVTKDRRAIIIDPVFFSEKFAAGPIFALPAEIRGRAIYKYGDAFDEYSKSSLVKSLQNAKYEHAENLLFDIEPGGSSKIKIDTVLKCPKKKETDLIVFETKANFLSDNPDNYIDELDKKYINGTDRKVGVSQLADWLIALSEQDKPPTEISEKPIGCVFPVLLLRDSSLTTPPHPEYFATKFRQKIDPKYSLSSGLMRKNNLLIAPLIIIPIGLIELMEQGLKRFSLLQLLTEYSSQNDQRIKSLNNFLYENDEYELIQDESPLHKRFADTVNEAVDFLKTTFTPNTSQDSDQKASS